MSLACALVGNFPALLACRLVQGIGVGGEMPVAATYISELSRAHGRGRFFLLYELIFPVGLAATGQLGAWLVPIFGWKIDVSDWRHSGSDRHGSPGEAPGVSP